MQSTSLSDYDFLASACNGPIASVLHLPISPPPPATHARIGRVTWRPEARVAQMALAMRQTALRRGVCNRADLLEAGFSPAEITRYGEEARANAARDADVAGERRTPEIPLSRVLAELLARKAAA